MEFRKESTRVSTTYVQRGMYNTGGALLIDFVLGGTRGTVINRTK